ncbi:MAG: ATP-binding cassette domain-containing protein [Cytophagales bacterium]|nr:ATP-binding cassette domain-containing protein [Cytophagales bacterium]
MIKLNVSKSLDSVEGKINLRLNLQIEKGQFVTIYGESGAGKTSTLRMLAGLLQPDDGEVYVDNEVWFNKQNNIDRAPQKRKVAYVFQDYALFPHLTVKGNLEFAQTTKDTAYLEELILKMELGELINRKPATLSGGQKQRVALARALAQKPEILLLDEPLAALDIKIRLKLQEYLRQIHQEYNLTTILISHDLGEIIKLSDRVFVLEKGQIIKSGSPTEVFVDQQISGKFKFTGEVTKIEKQEVVYIVTVLIDQNVVKVIAQETEINNLKIGDKVMVASKAFNPLIYKIDE